MAEQMPAVGMQRKLAAEVLRMSPNFSVDTWGQILPFKDPAVLERGLAALRKAGLRVGRKREEKGGAGCEQASELASEARERSDQEKDTYCMTRVIEPLGSRSQIWPIPTHDLTHLT